MRVKQRLPPSQRTLHGLLIASVPTAIHGQIEEGIYNHISYLEVYFANSITRHLIPPPLANILDALNLTVCKIDLVLSRISAGYLHHFENSVRQLFLHR